MQSSMDSMQQVLNQALLVLASTKEEQQLHKFLHMYLATQIHF